MVATINASGTKPDLFLGIFFLALSALAISLPHAAQTLHSLVGVLTEGNSSFKSFFFVLFLGLLFLARAYFPQRRPAGNAAFPAVAAVSLLWGAFLSAMLLSQYGAGVNSFVSHVTGCGQGWCWEGTYLQHSHAAKTAVHFIWKHFGIGLGPMADDGKPMYEIFPLSDAAAPLTILLCLLVLACGSLAAASEPGSGNALLLAMSAFLFFIASFDGCPFTTTSVNAFALLMVYYSGKSRALGEWGRLLAPLMAAALAAFLPNLLFGSYLVIRDWFAPSAFASALFAFAGSRTGWKKITLLGILIFSAANFASVLLGRVSGPQLDITRASLAAPGLPTSPNLVVYGLPPMATAADVAAKADGFSFQAAEKYGWYFAGAAVAPTPIRTTTWEFQRGLRDSFGGGYLYARMNRNAPQTQGARILWIRRPPSKLDFSTFSFRPIKVEDAAGSGETGLFGIASASGPDLALELGSYIRSRGGDAVVITLIV